MSYLEFVNRWMVIHSLLKVCQWLLRNSKWDAVSLDTIMRFEGYEGLRVFHVLIIIMVMRVMRVYEGFEGKYLTSSCIYYWFRTINGWRTINTTYFYRSTLRLVTISIRHISHISNIKCWSRRENKPNCMQITQKFRIFTVTLSTVHNYKILCNQ